MVYVPLIREQTSSQLHYQLKKRAQHVPVTPGIPSFPQTFFPQSVPTVFCKRKTLPFNLSSLNPCLPSAFSCYFSRSRCLPKCAFLILSWNLKYPRPKVPHHPQQVGHKCLGHHIKGLLIYHFFFLPKHHNNGDHSAKDHSYIHSPLHTAAKWSFKPFKTT